MRLPPVFRFRRVATGAAIAVIAATAFAYSSQSPTTAPLALASTAAPVAVGDGQFHVVGTSIVDPAGNPFVPRGVNKAGLEASAKGYDVGWWNFSRMKDWGANVVRIPLNDSYWLPSMCSYDSTYAARVDSIVQWAESLKMLVILDDHRSTQGATCGSAGWNNAQKMADARNVEFVQSLATRYKSHPWVAFDLYNEPHDISDAVWRSGGSVDGWTAVGMQQLLDAVRATGNNNLVFVSGNAWANDLRMIVGNPLLNDANVVYAAHTYPFYCRGVMQPNTQAYSCQGKQTPPFLDTMIAPAMDNHAVMITEFGTRRNFASDNAAVIAWAENHHAGWVAYAWCSGAITDYCLETPDYSGNPSVTGQPIKDGLAPYKAA